MFHRIVDEHFSNYIRDMDNALELEDVIGLSWAIQQIARAGVSKERLDDAVLDFWILWADTNPPMDDDIFVQLDDDDDLSFPLRS